MLRRSWWDLNPTGRGTYNFTQTGSGTYNFSHIGSGTYNFLASKFSPDAQSSYICIYDAH